MWLINTNTIKLESFVDERQTKYAILSHRWADEEVTFQKFSSDDPSVVSAVRKMKGFWKIEQCCQQALRDGLQYAWVDTCCIDKSSSAELQEAINSMFRYYEMAEVCYAYLSDVTTIDDDSFSHSEWFTRGWTLQELIAPQHMIFFYTHWRPIGTRKDLASSIEATCGVPHAVLVYGWEIAGRSPCIATIMSWASGRSTTRIEDRAYSLLGLFNVNMPLLYGEGKKAFQRLQEEIFKCTEDQTIFAWEGVTTDSPFLFASSPDQFPKGRKYPPSDALERRKPHMVTNEGILFEAEMLLIRPQTYLVPLNISSYDLACIILRKLDQHGRYGRIPGSLLHSSLGDVVERGVFERREKQLSSQRKVISVVRKLRDYELWAYKFEEALAFEAIGRKTELALGPYTRDKWFFYSSGTSYDNQSRQLAKSGWGGWMARKIPSGHTRHKVIESGHYLMGPVAIMEIRSRAVSYGLLGFDEDYLPVCILSTRLLATKVFSDLSELFRRCETSKPKASAFVPDPADVFSLDKDESSTKTLEMVAIKGGNYKELRTGVIAIRTNNVERGMKVCILVKPILATLRGDHQKKTRDRFTDSTLEAMRHISLSITHSGKDDPWSVKLEVHQTKNSSEEPRCWRCSEDGKPTTVHDDDVDSDWNSDLEY